MLVVDHDIRDRISQLIKPALVTTSTKKWHGLCDLNVNFTVHFILIKLVFSYHLSYTYVTLFQCSLERSHKTGLIVLLINYKTAKEMNGLCERTEFKKSQYQYNIGKTWWV